MLCCRSLAWHKNWQQQLDPLHNPCFLTTILRWDQAIMLMTLSCKRKRGKICINNWCCDWMCTYQQSEYKSISVNWWKPDNAEWIITWKLMELLWGWMRSYFLCWRTSRKLLPIFFPPPICWDQHLSCKNFVKSNLSHQKNFYFPETSSVYLTSVPLLKFCIAET